MGDFFYRIGQSLLSISIKQALLGAGLGLATYKGLSSMLESMIDKATTSMQSGDGIALAFLGMSGMDTAMSIVLSACVIRMTITSTSVFITKAV